MVWFVREMGDDGNFVGALLGIGFPCRVAFSSQSLRASSQVGIVSDSYPYVFVPYSKLPMDFVIFMALA